MVEQKFGSKFWVFGMGAVVVCWEYVEVREREREMFFSDDKGRKEVGGGYNTINVSD